MISFISSPATFLAPMKWQTKKSWTELVQRKPSISLTFTAPRWVVMVRMASEWQAMKGTSSLWRADGKQSLWPPPTALQRYQRQSPSYSSQWNSWSLHLFPLEMGTNHWVYRGEKGPSVCRSHICQHATRVRGLTRFKTISQNQEAPPFLLYRR